MNQSHGAQGPESPKPWTRHIPGWARHLTQGLLTDACYHKPLSFTLSPTRQSIRSLITVLHIPLMEILYQSSDMVLCAHSDAGFHNESKGRSRAGDHIFLSENDAMPQWNGSVLTLAKIIKFVMSSASKAKLGALFITAQEIVAMRNTLEEMKWSQPKSPTQTDNSAAAGIVKNTIVHRKCKTMDSRLHCLRCREAQGQFRYYWASGNLNWGYYSTKNHPPLYQE